MGHSVHARGGSSSGGGTACAMGSVAASCAPLVSLVARCGGLGPRFAELRRLLVTRRAAGAAGAAGQPGGARRAARGGQRARRGGGRQHQRGGEAADEHHAVAAARVPARGGAVWRDGAAAGAGRGRLPAAAGATRRVSACPVFFFTYMAANLAADSLSLHNGKSARGADAAVVSPTNAPPLPPPPLPPRPVFPPRRRGRWTGSSRTQRASASRSCRSCWAARRWRRCSRGEPRCRARPPPARPRPPARPPPRRRLRAAARRRRPSTWRRRW